MGDVSDLTADGLHVLRPTAAVRTSMPGLIAGPFIVVALALIAFADLMVQGIILAMFIVVFSFAASQL
jgi:hypothetical protein